MAFRCLGRGHYTITKYDGRKCPKCGGMIIPVGEATYADKMNLKDISVNVELTGIEKVNKQLNDVESQLDRISKKQEEIINLNY